MEGNPLTAMRFAPYLLDRRLDVVGAVVTPVHDQQILDLTWLTIWDSGVVAAGWPVGSRFGLRGCALAGARICRRWLS
jgi:hypothetical protein